MAPFPAPETGILLSHFDWTAKGAQFLTPPVDHGVELRCYLHDPDGHLIEVGQSNRDFLKERGLLG